MAPTGVPAVLAKDLPGGDVPEQHGLVEGAGAELGVVAGALRVQHLVAVAAVRLDEGTPRWAPQLDRLV